jgi:hypothetical protein
MAAEREENLRVSRANWYQTNRALDVEVAKKCEREASACFKKNSPEKLKAQRVRFKQNSPEKARAC